MIPCSDKVDVNVGEDGVGVGCNPPPPRMTSNGRRGEGGGLKK